MDPALGFWLCGTPTPPYIMEDVFKFILVCVLCLLYMYNSTIKLQLSINQLFCVGTLKIKEALNLKKLRQILTLKCRIHVLSRINSILDRCYCSFRSSQVLRFCVYTLVLKITPCVLWSLYLHSRERSGDGTFQRMFLRMFLRTFPRTLQVKSLRQGKEK